jgi:hypothetical protein
MEFLMKNFSRWKRCAATAVLLTFLQWNVGAECKVYESEWNDYKSIVMENDLVRVTILPDSNGSITEYHFKQPNFNVIAPVENLKFGLTKTVAVADTNFGGYKDWNFEIGALKAERAYSCKIVEKSRERVAVLAAYASNVRLERLMTLRDNSTLVEIEITIANIYKAPCKYSYWSHIMIMPAGRVNNREVFYVPVGAGLVSTRNSACFKSDQDTVAEAVNSVNACASSDFLPIQGWKGVLNKELKTLYAEVLPVEQVGKDGYFGFWKGQKGGELGNPISLLTSESVFSSQEIKPGESIKLKLSLLQTLGLGGLAHCSANLCLNITPRQTKTGNKPLTVEVNSPRTLANHKLSLLLIGAGGKVAAPLAEQMVSLAPTSASTFKVGLDKFPAAKGVYGLRYTLKNEQGEELETSDLPGVKITNE